MSYEKEKQVAIDAAIAAAKLCQQVRQSIPAAIEKSDKSPVTVADYGSQALICKAVSDAFGDDPIVAEEDAATLSQPDMKEPLDRVVEYAKELRSDATPENIIAWIDRGNGTVSDRYWTLDPIDGTKGFLRQDQYAVALALVEGGEIKVGVLACPALPMATGEVGTLFVAVRGEGAYQAPLSGGDLQPIRVASMDDTESLRFVESVESGHGDQSRQAAIAQAVGITAPSLRMDSQAKYGAVASGQALLYLRLPSPKSPDYREKIWDHAAGVIVVEEAGGKVTDMYGKPLDFSKGAKMVDNQGVVVSNGTIHQKAIDALAG
ncbi:MAG TPA: 3'(2'),5'-bisphosphate nucleotidase [Oscillatoriales cyanobacterium M59_W2019_021]|nr:MAG: 3'(2'),5'-bisphosphate nucleotidase [Cyanobacteria bacterium J055]HIK33399.1 3'(2'),5'-bisphosphate nucleotidase [Oscillatoriales cyanobacterium M4454_W2019_049]HIK52354.1 3'(2'),5'-bisphosphate nucleotidase [Oscillatoriales cyanobacterium M59_W2019_021]